MENNVPAMSSTVAIFRLDIREEQAEYAKDTLETKSDRLKWRI